MSSERVHERDDAGKDEEDEKVVDELPTGGRCIEACGAEGTQRDG